MSKIQIENNSLIGGGKLQMETTIKCSECNGGIKIEMQNGTSQLANEKDGIEKENRLLLNDNPQIGMAENNGEIGCKYKEENEENGNGLEGTSIARKYANFGFGTAAIHASINPQRWDMHQIVPPISLSITYQQPEPNKPVGHEYSREGSPIRDILEDTIAALEQAKYCRVFSSGMSSTVAIANWIPTGGHVIHFDDGYMGTQQFFCKLRDKGLIELSFVDLNNLEKLKAALKENTKMIFFETPSNPLLKVVDIKAVSQIVKAHNPECVIVVDNTLLSPYFQRPLLLGADAVLHSMTKYINGHSDVLVGAIATNLKWMHEHLSEQQKLFGSVLSSFDAWLCVRGIKTLHLRMRQHQENGLRVARWLEADKRVKKVICPALDSHPHHAIHKKQTNGMSGMISIFLHGNLESTKKFLTSLQIFRLSASLGDIISIADFIPMVAVNGVLPELGDDKEAGDNLIRLSVGCEDVQDLIADLDQALEASSSRCCIDIKD